MTVSTKLSFRSTIIIAEIVCFLSARFFKVWALKPAVVNESLNLGTNDNGIDLALKIRSCDVICPMHCLRSLKIVAEL